MSINISGLGNTYNGINTNSKQYKALKEKGNNKGKLTCDKLCVFKGLRDI